MCKDEQLWFSRQLGCIFIVEHDQEIFVFDLSSIRSEDDSILSVRHDNNDGHLGLRVVFF